MIRGLVAASIAAILSANVQAQEAQPIQSEALIKDTDVATDPVPTGNPGTWATPSDYPSRALREAREGVTRFRLEVNSAGRVQSCIITSSSGHADLDETTCSLLSRQARFEPARSKSGEAVRGTWTNAVRWKIPGGANSAPEAGELETVMIVEVDGRMTECDVIIAVGSGESLNKFCAQNMVSRPILGEDGKPQRTRVRTKVSIVHEPVEADSSEEE